jgi:hypothetical protein
MRARALLQPLVLALPVATLLGAGWVHRSITDDGFIYLRVVQQIGAGNGPVFNVGERVEAFTGVLWVALLALLDLLTPIRLEWLAVGQLGMFRFERAEVALAPEVPLPVAAVYTVGMMGYAMATGFHMIDVLGLADPLTAHLETKPSRTDHPRIAGYDRPLPAPWLAARLTPALALRRAADEPLTPRRFAENFVHSFGNARLRIPPDPEQAHRRHCGPDTPPEVLAARGSP